MINEYNQIANDEEDVDDNRIEKNNKHRTITNE